MRRISLPVLLPAFALLALGAGLANAGGGDRGGGWPTVEKQLAADRVEPGSRLAELIRDNQEFALLRPEEASDRISVPPWLRVYWRKAHPEMEFSATDPTGGYPLVLKEMHEWMVSHPDLGLGTASTTAAKSADKRKPAKPMAHPVAGPDRNITGEPGVPRSESDIRIDFWHPERILAASNNIEGSGALAIYYSHDGGESWGHTQLPKGTNASFHSDPTAEWTSDGTAWATTLSIDSGTRELSGHAFRSDDGGATWNDAGSFSEGQTQVDKQMTWVDHAAGSPFADNLYVIWHNGYDVYMNHRSPSGEWGAPLQVSGSETTGTGIGSDVKTNKLGTVYGFWPDTGSQKLFVVRSTNGGATYSKPQAIASTFGWFDIGIPAQNHRRVLIYVTAGAFYRSKAKNMVYAAWTDLAGGRGCSHWAEEPGPNRESTCTSRIWFTRSSNGGTKWAKPVMVNNPKSLNDQFAPWLAVDETTGNLVLAYYDSLGEDRDTTNVWAQASIDDGATWSAAYRVTTAPTSENGSLANGNQYGDYNGLSGYGGVFFPSWTDRRGGAGTQEAIWTAPLTLEAGAQANGAALARTPSAACLFRPWFADLDDAASFTPAPQPVCR